MKNTAASATYKTIKTGDVNDTYMLALDVGCSGDHELIRIGKRDLEFVIGEVYRVEYDAGIYPGTVEEWDRAVLRKAEKALAREEAEPKLPC